MTPGTTGARANTQYIVDEFMRRTQLALGQPSAHGTFVHLYLNGLYWGLYNLTERPDSSFAATYLRRRQRGVGRADLRHAAGHQSVGDLECHAQPRPAGHGQQRQLPANPGQQPGRDAQPGL